MNTVCDHLDLLAVYGHQQQAQQSRR